MKRLKILYTIPNFDTAGSQKVVHDLAKHLNKQLFDVHISCSHNRGLFFKEIEKLDLPIHIIDTTIPLRPYIQFFTRINPVVNFLKEQNFDIVHSWHWSSDWTEIIAARLAGAKYIYTKKAMTWGSKHWKIKSWLSDFIITLNPEMKNYFPRKKTQKFIPLGINVNYFDPALFEPKKNSINFRIVTVANLVPVKGIELIIDALYLLQDRNIELLIVGDDTSTYAQKLKDQTNYDTQNYTIQFLGKKEEIRPFLMESDLYVISSYNEGMPAALIEAMSMGILVLGSNISGVNTILRDFKDLMFESGNSSQLAEKINWIKRLPEEDKMKTKKRLRQLVIDNYSLNSFIKEHETLYRKLLSH